MKKPCDVLLRPFYSILSEYFHNLFRNITKSTGKLEKNISVQYKQILSLQFGSLSFLLFPSLQRVQGF